MRELPLPIEDYALIGNTRSAALVAKDGSIDWLCFPRFDSPACFAALLGTHRNGRFALTPKDPVTSTRRRYRTDTLILETELTTATGTVRIVDCMPVDTHAPAVVRIVEGVRGEVPMHLQLVIRFDYGWVVPWVRTVRGHLHAVAGPDALSLRTPVITHGENLTTVADFTVREGERVPFVLQWHSSTEHSPKELDPFEALEGCERWWHRWTSHCVYRGPWRDAVVRSLITLKALTYSPTGGMVAAATTSLPAPIGGVRNWDYRITWLRDATFTLYSFLLSGYKQEAVAWRDWLLRAVAGAPEQLQIMYGLGGERRMPELELDWLPGYHGSAPVRIGNAAVKQLQLDVYGEVMDALHIARKVGMPPEQNSWHVQKLLLDFLESGWRQADEGIWEVRGARQHFTHSKVMAWVAFDRAVKAVEQLGRDGDVGRWRAARATIHAEVCERGFDADRGAFVQAYGSKELDAALLMIPLVGFLPAKDPRVLATTQAIETDLRVDGLVRRYHTSKTDDGLPPGEGAFLLCSFWLADNWALQGRTEDATRLFEHLLSLCNDVGLLSEQYDVANQRQLGNFPQAFSHVGLVNTAFTLNPDMPTPVREQYDDQG
jgi:GH15 family glucan-1,4-alpha-glucosidase